MSIIGSIASGVSGLGNDIGSVFGNNTTGQSHDIFGNAPTIPQAIVSAITNANSTPTTTPSSTPPANQLAPSSSSSSKSSSGSSTGASSSTDSSGSTSTNPAAQAYYNDIISQLQSAIGGLQGEQDTGVNNIESAYDKSLDEENQNESSALSTLAGDTNTNATQRETNIGSINSNANSAYSALMSLLGQSGAGVSSVARVNAPQAISQNASQQRGGANTTFNTNQAGIDTATASTKQQYQNALDDLLNQKNTNTQSFLSGLLGTEQQDQQQIAADRANAAQYGGQTFDQASADAAGDQNQANNIQSQLNQIFQQYATPAFSVNPVSVTQPNMTQYSVDPTTVKAQTANPTTDSSFLPYLTSLNQQPNLLAGGATTPAVATS